MKTLCVLASVIIVLVLDVSGKVEAQKRKPIKVIEHTTPEILWVKTNLPSAVDTFTAKLAINSSGHIFAGTGNGIYRSTDSGNHWIQINDGLKYDSFGKLFIFALAINSSGHVFVAIYNELYRSTDNGDHWTKIKSGFTASDLAVNSSGHIFAGAAADGVYRSTDNGATWTQINNGFNSNVVNSIAMNSDGDVFAGAYDGVYRSTDNGNHWTQKLNFDGGNSAHAFAINSSGNIFVGVDSNARVDQGTEGVYRSTNNGDNWTRIIRNYGHEIESFDGAWAIVINSSGHMFLGTRSGVYRSTNNGGNWTKISKGLNLSKGLSDKNVSALAINPGGIMFAVTPAGVYRLNAPPSSVLAQPVETRIRAADTRAPRPSLSPAPPRMSPEKAFYYFIAIYGAPDNAIERYGNYFDVGNYRRAMADEFERGRYTEMIRARIADGVRKIDFGDKFTFVGTATFEGYTMLGEYSFESHSFPLVDLPYDSFCINMDRASGICYGTFLNVGRNARVQDAVNGTEFNWSLPMSEAEARAFVKSRSTASPGGVDRRVAAKITYSVMNKKGKLSDGRDIFIPYVYSVEIYSDESLTKKLGVIPTINSLASRNPEELRAAEERVKEEAPEKLRALLTTHPVLDGTKSTNSGSEKVTLRVMSFDSGTGSVSAEVDFIGKQAPMGTVVSPRLPQPPGGHSSRAVGNVSGDTLNLTVTWTEVSFLGELTTPSMHLKLQFNGFARRLVGQWANGNEECPKCTIWFDLK